MQLNCTLSPDIVVPTSLAENVCGGDLSLVSDQ